MAEWDEWYLLRARPRQEARAVENLENQGFFCYCPMLKKRSGRIEALFPGYMFLRADHNDANELPWQKVRSTRGVMGFVRFGQSEPRLLPMGLVEALRERERIMGTVPDYKPGQTVTFKSGPFAELDGIYLQDKGENRSIILITILNRQQAINVEQVALY